MPVRGVRGATVVKEDSHDQISSATQELLQSLLQANPKMELSDLACAIFTVTQDLCSLYPAEAAREIGWIMIPMISAQEIPVPGGLSKCIRVLLQWNTELTQEEIRHVYLHEATRLRPDLIENGRKSKF